MPILFIAAVEALARWRAVGSARRPGGLNRLGRLGRLGRLNRLGRLGRPIGRARRSRGRLWTGVRGGLARHAAAMMAAVAVTLAFQFPLSDLWHGSTYTISPQVAADNAAMAVVPDGATVQTTLDLLAPLAARTDTFWIGNSGKPADGVPRLRRQEQRLQPGPDRRFPPSSPSFTRRPATGRSSAAATSTSSAAADRPPPVRRTASRATFRAAPAGNRSLLVTSGGEVDVTRAPGGGRWPTPGPGSCWPPGAWPCFSAGKTSAICYSYAAVFFAVLTVEHLIADGRPPSLVDLRANRRRTPRRSHLLPSPPAHRLSAGQAGRWAARALRRRG